ncbi:MAG: class I SAM-dependent methyltransferase [Planctomycetes bacterium]|nr:class I SAM-dependent methyltransferase [Planctomycetota bacterium]
MKENKYDDSKFFDSYSKMARSVGGLEAAGEWRQFRAMFPPLHRKRVLDLGCGYGWHCQYAAEHGALEVVGVDISEKMLAEAVRRNKYPNVTYLRSAIEDVDFPDDSFDLVISSLAFHYVEHFAEVCDKVRAMLAPQGDFIFSVEHPVFTAEGSQDWCRDPEGSTLHWPVDNYFIEGWRQATFLGEKVSKFHRTVTTYLNTLMERNFVITGLVEPEPDEQMLREHKEMLEELRRPMMMLVSARIQ